MENMLEMTRNFWCQWKYKTCALYLLAIVPSAEMCLYLQCSGAVS